MELTTSQVPVFCVAAAFEPVAGGGMSGGTDPDLTMPSWSVSVRARQRGGEAGLTQFVDETEVGLQVVTIRVSDVGFAAEDECRTWTRVQGHMALEGQPAVSSEGAIRRVCQQNQAQEKAPAGNP